MKAYFRRHSRQKIVAICLALAFLYAVPFFTIPGNAAGYLKIEGISGESTDSAHKDWINLDSFQFEVRRNIQLRSDGSREVSTPTISEVTVVKSVDKATPKLFTSAVLGTDGVPGEIHVTKAVGESEEVYLKITLSDILVSSLSASGRTSGDERLTENVSLNFLKIGMDYTPFVDGKPQEPVSADVDLREVK